MNVITHINQFENAKDVEAFKGLVQTLRSLPEIEPSAYLTQRIMNAVNDDGNSQKDDMFYRSSRNPSLKPWLGAAAAAAVVLALFVFRSVFITQMHVANSTLSDNEEWLARFQEVDGSWNPARHGGAKVYQPALTALSALALYQAGSDYLPQVELACNYLQKIQQRNGTFGGEGRESFYNQAIVTFVLARTTVNATERDALQLACSAITTAQTVEGGWDYVPDSEGNAAITSWQIQALAAARDAGVPDLDVSIKKGLRWLRSVTDDRGAVSYKRDSRQMSDTVSALTAETLLTAGADFPELSTAGHRVVEALKNKCSSSENNDLYRDCMSVRAFKSAGEIDTVALLKKRVFASASTADDDQWGKVGGRLYMKSLYSLTRTF